jgi:hypothetical protein
MQLVLEECRMSLFKCPDKITAATHLRGDLERSKANTEAGLDSVGKVTDMDRCCTEYKAGCKWCGGAPPSETRDFAGTLLIITMSTTSVLLYI